MPADGETTRLAFSLIVPRTSLERYQARHAELWPELRDSIRDQGGSNYSIFAAPKLDRVFGYVEVADLDLWRSGSDTALATRWWRHMADLMPTNDDYSPIGMDLHEVFHQD